MFSSPTDFWVAFNVFIFLMLAMDLWLHRKPKVISIKAAIGWSFFWIGLAVAFAPILYYIYDRQIAGFGTPEVSPHHGLSGRQAALQYLTAYLIEESLSVDNLFIFLLIFSYFHVEPKHQHRVLFWGILGAVICRAIFILVGMELVHRFHWLIYFFGGFLVYTGASMAFKSQEKIDPEHNRVLKLVKKFLPVTHRFDGAKFFTREHNRLVATPLFVVLIVVESTDVMFATDSIPAVIAITQDRFIAYTSNIFAILGLRAMYFALAGMMEKFHALHYGLAAILAFVGAKMLISGWYEVPVSWTLACVALTLVASVVVSLRFPKPAEPELPTPPISEKQEKQRP
jgi:tellurite resistance protein TerC